MSKYLKSHIIHETLKIFREFSESVLYFIKKTGKILLSSDACDRGSYLNDLARNINDLCFDYLDAPVVNCTGKDVPMPYAANLEKLALVTVPEVIAACKSVLYR